MSKDLKDIQIKVRVSKSEKEQIDAYCEAHDLTVSEFLRIAYQELLNGKKETELYWDEF